jgi:hypothetical protein
MPPLLRAAFLYVMAENEGGKVNWTTGEVTYPK